MKPVVGISADSVTLRKTVPASAVYDTYVKAVVQGAGAMPWVMPPLGSALVLDDFLARVDGLLLTGSLSNVEPCHYAGEPSDPGTLHDPSRDETTLPLIRRALTLGVPLLGICRGFQELNVALGGTLHQKVQDQHGLLDHRAPTADTMAGRFVDQHDVEVKVGGELSRLCGAGSFLVNSLHEQGVDRLAAGLQIEAVAPDGLVEGFSVTDAPAFALAVEWHPEWQFEQSAINSAIWKAFGKACLERAASRGAE